MQLQQQVGLDVREASALFDQARQSRLAWEDKIVTPLRANLADAEESYASGESSYLFVLENSRRLIEARVREREIAADEQRAQARIERAAGIGMSRRERRNAVSRERCRVACLVACLGATAAVASCGRDAAPPAAAPAAAKVTAAVPEAALTTMTLTAEAQKRLGIETAPVEQRTIARSRSLGGEIVARRWRADHGDRAGGRHAGRRESRARGRLARGRRDRSS